MSEPRLRALRASGLCGRGVRHLPEPVALPDFLECSGLTEFDLDIELRKTKEVHRCRLVVLPGKQESGADGPGSPTSSS